MTDKELIPKLMLLKLWLAYKDWGSDEYIEVVDFAIQRIEQIENHPALLELPLTDFLSRIIDDDVLEGIPIYYAVWPIAPEKGEIS